MDRRVYRWHDQLEAKHWWYGARRKIISTIITQFAPKGRRLKVLEAGCGTGGNLQMLSGFGDVSAFELDAESRELAEGKLPIGVKHGMLPDDIPFQRGSYDVVAAFDVIEHVEQDVESLRSMGERLSQDGRLIITVPACPWLWSKHDDLNHHFRRYTHKSLSDALAKAGLKTEHVSYFNTFLFPLIAGLRVLRVKLGLNEPDEVAMPGKFTNSVLQAIFGSERWFVGRISLPVGVSLVAVAKRA